MMQYIWLVHGRPIRHLVVARGVCYVGDLAGFTAAPVYACRAGSAGLVAVLGLPGALLVPLLTSWAGRVRRDWLSLADINSRIADPGPDLALLRQVAFFRPLPFAVIEHLATNCRRRPASPAR